MEPKAIWLKGKDIKITPEIPMLKMQGDIETADAAKPVCLSFRLMNAKAMRLTLALGIDVTELISASDEGNERYLRFDKARYKRLNGMSHRIANCNLKRHMKGCGIRKVRIFNGYEWI